MSQSPLPQAWLKRSLTVKSRLETHLAGRAWDRRSRASARTEYLRPHARQCRNVVQHVGIRSVGQRAMTLPCRDAPAHFLDFVAEPNLLEIVVVVAQIAEIIGSHAARPHGPIGIDLGAYPAGIAVDDLIFLVQNALDQLVVLHSKCLGDLGHTRELLTFDISNQ